MTSTDLPSGADAGVDHDDRRDNSNEEKNNGVEGAGKGEEKEEEASLSQLLAALAFGARAVQGLPFDDEFAFQASFPEFASQLGTTKAALLDILSMVLPYQDLSSFPTKNAWSSSCEDDDDDDFDYSQYDDPQLWEKCAEACDALLEDVETYLEEADTDETLGIRKASQSQWENWSRRARQRAQGSLGRILDGLVDMVKPQITYNITAQNDRLLPFRPAVHPDKPFAVTPLDLSLQPGHGLDTRLSSIRNGTIIKYPDNIVAPSHHVAHLYQAEIESFSYRSWQLQTTISNSDEIPIAVPDELEATFIDTEPALEALVRKLAAVSHLALDLEAHSHRSFSGMTCLMQLTIRDDGANTKDSTNDHNNKKHDLQNSKMENYLLDPFALGASVITKHLAAILANPDIVKVMHGADGDIAWLQRDFGLYVVNLFDTGRAARALRFPSAGLAYLLEHYVGIRLTDNRKKQFQLSDWRQRPLPSEMLQYAIQDTHYLLDIYERIKSDLQQPNSGTSITHVLDISRKVCLIRYDKEPFQPDGYSWLLAGRRSGRHGSTKKHSSTRRPEQQQQLQQSSALTPSQERVLAALWDWRDQTARDCDESHLYVCPNPALVRLSVASPTTVIALQELLNPIPPLLLHCAPDVVDRIKEAMKAQEREDDRNVRNEDDVSKHFLPSGVVAEDDEDDDEEVATSSRKNSTTFQQANAHVGAPSSAFFKPTGLSSGSQDPGRGGLLSPVLGTEALYRQAGWITPHNHPDDEAAVSRPSHEAKDERAEQVIETIATSTGDDYDLDNMPAPSAKPKHLVVVDRANQNYKSADYTTHSFDMKNSGEVERRRSRGRSVDGLGATRAAQEHSKSPVRLTAEEQAQQAQQTASHVRIRLSSKASELRLISARSDFGDDEEDDDDGDDAIRREQDSPDKLLSRGPSDEIDQFTIPRSLKEIYKISNQNRRNKKSSPTPERGGMLQEKEEEMRALAKAEEILKARGLSGKGYFDSGNNACGNKRQRTKSTESESEHSPSALSDGTNNITRDDDITFMQELGWIKNKEEAEKILKQKQGDRVEIAPETGQGCDEAYPEDEESGALTSKSKDKNLSTTAFDYSALGPIGAYQTQSSSNPFFSGAALAGGALAQGSARPPDRKRGVRGGKQQAKARERPEKNDGRTQVYKKK